MPGSVSWSSNPLYSSSGSLTVAGDGSFIYFTPGGEIWAIGNNPLSTGSYYFEVSFRELSGDNFIVGVAPFPYESSLPWAGVDQSGNVSLNGGTAIGNIGTISAGNTVEFAVAVSSGKLWARLNGGFWNGSSSANPATGTGGLNISSLTAPLAPMVAQPSGVTSQESEFIINAGQERFIETPPSGFVQWPAPNSLFYSLNWSQTPLETAGGVITVSNDGVTLTLSSGGQVWAGSNNPQSSGNFYFELTITEYASGNTAPGIANSYYSSTGAMIGVFPISSGQIYAATATSGGYYNTGMSIGSLGVGDVVRCAVALPNYVWFSLNGGPWNGNSSADPVAGTGGISLASMSFPMQPCVGCPDGVSTNSQLVLNTGESGFAYSLPTGYEGWPAPQILVLNPVAVVEYGNPLNISGEAYNGNPEILYYSTDGTHWTECSSYSSGDSWTALGPTYPGAATGFLSVGSSNSGAYESNSTSFAVTGPTTSGGALIASNVPTLASGTYDPMAGTWSSSVAGTWYLTTSYEPPSGESYTGYEGLANLFEIAPEGCVLGWSNVNQKDPEDGYHSATALGQLVYESAATTLALGISSFVFQINYSFPPKVQTFGVFYLGAGSVNTDGIATYEIIFPNSGTGTFTGPGGSVTFDGQPGGTFYLEMFQDPDSGDLTASLLFQGSSVGVLGPASATGFGEFSTEGIYFGFAAPSVTPELRNGAPNPELSIDFSAYDTSAGSETLTITSATGTFGGVSLIGTNSGHAAEALDYRLDNAVDYADEPIWNTMAIFSPGTDWTGYAPVSTPGTHTIMVRDHAEEGGSYITSNTVTFVVPNGYFYWNGIILG